jgi:dTDP-4-amino-4,6-dideoxygalactose transaminase
MNKKWPYFASDEIAAVEKILQSGKVNYWTGEEGKFFEREYAEYLKVSHCVALANGTLALEAALYALEIGTGDDVIVPARTFIASASCVIARGARPIVADVCLNTHNITVEAISAAITPQTKAIIVVHLGGMPCDMDPIMAFAKERGLKVIEDCAQAHGAFYKGKPIGSFGDAAAFSFCQDKIITTGGEGGLLALHDTQGWKRALSYKDHGKDPDQMSIKYSSSSFRWLHNSFGSNWRMTEMQATLGRIQLKKLPQWVEIRRKNASILTEYLSSIPLFKTMNPSAEYHHSYYRYYALINIELLKVNWTRDKIIQLFHEHNIECGVGSCPEIYLEKAFLNAGLAPEVGLPNAKFIGERSIAFLVHPTLTDEDMHNICNNIKKTIALVHDKAF